MVEGCGGCCLALVLIPVLCCVAVGGVVYVTNTQAPDPPVSDSFQPSQTQANEFQVALDNAVNTARNQGWFWLQFNEQQISSWMALEGEQFADDHGHVFPFTDMQVGLDDGEITFYGALDPGVMALPVEVVIEPQISATGDIEFDIVSVEVSGVRAPDFVTQVVSAQFEDLLVGPLRDLPGDVIFYQQSLSIDNGNFEVQGAVSP